jgi:hypothetical protein
MPANRLDLPSGAVHNAIVGEQGVVYAWKAIG